MGPWGVFMIVMLILNSVISLFYYLSAANRVLFGAVPEEQRVTRSVPFMMALPVVILAGLTVLLGLWPELGLLIVDPAAEHLDTLLGIN